MKRIGPLGSTTLGAYLVLIGIAPYVPLLGLGLLTSALAIAAGVLILMGR